MNETRKLSLRVFGKITGVSFLVIVIGYTLNWTLIFSKIISSGDELQTFTNISTKELLLRFGIVSNLLLAIFSILLAWSLYNLLEKQNHEISLFAFIIRLVDPFLSLITVSISYISLQLLNVKDYSVYYGSDTISQIIGMLFNLYTSTSTIPMVFTSLGFIIFFIVLLQTKIVPKLLTIFGIISYSIILVYVVIKILGMGDSSSILGSIELVFYTPSVVFELIAGIFFIVKNIDLKDYQETKT